MSNKTDDAGAAAKAAAATGGTGKKHLGILVDESGSMKGLREHVVTGVNEFTHAFRERKRTRVWVAFFDHHPGAERLRIKVRNVKAADVTDLGIGDYNPRGLTPLNDAILEMLDVMDGAVGEGETGFLAIITDGLENKSEADATTVAAAIAEREKRGWGFVYIGANQDAEAAAAAIGLRRTGQAFNFAATGGGVRASTRAAGQTASAYAAGGQSAAADYAESLYATTGGILPDDDPQAKTGNGDPATGTGTGNGDTSNVGDTGGTGGGDTGGGFDSGGGGGGDGS